MTAKSVKTSRPTGRRRAPKASGLPEKQSNQADIARNQQISDIIESLPASFLLCDADDRVIICNNRYKEWFFPGLEHEIYPGRTFNELLSIFHKSALSAEARNGVPWVERRARLRREPGTPFEHHLKDGRVLRVFERRTSDGGMVTIHTDITDLTRQKDAVAETSDQLQITLEAIDQGISMMDADLKCGAVNRRFLELLDLPKELGNPGTPFEAFIRYNAERGEYGAGDIDELVRERIELARKFLPHCFERTRPDGTVIEVRGKPVPSGGFVTTYTDITERKKAEEKLRKHEEELEEQIARFDAALANMSQGLCMFDRDKNLLVCNDRFIEIYNLPPALAKRGTPFKKIVEHRVASGVYCGDDPGEYIRERLTAVEELKPSTKIHELTNGRIVAIVFQPMTGGGWVATHEDITELQRIQARLAHMALHDTLTDLPNRALFRERMLEMDPHIKRGERFAVMCLDLDRFKGVNDTLGHPVGDKLLIAAADRLRSCVREVDTIARLGGDEFAILQASDDHPEHTAALAQRICDTMAVPFEIDGHQVVIGASIGIAFAPGDGESPDDLLRNADMALYRAKNDGRGIYCFFEPEMDARMQARRHLELDLRKALDAEEFELHYQPLVDMQSGEIAGFEALLRWPHPERGPVSPGEFIPIAEDIGLIIPLGEWVIRKACADAASWPRNIRIAVNLSPAQFRSENLVNTVFSALARSQLAPQRLELEITENALLENSESTLKTLHALRDMGVRIAMDDFGTGYSSLSYLRSFPFDKIKIDGSFVRDLSGKPDAAAIVNAVASLSRSLGMVTTAEGVETEAQRELVKAAGYTEMQGFLFSPALKSDALQETFFSGKKKKSANG